MPAFLVQDGSALEQGSVDLGAAGRFQLRSAQQIRGFTQAEARAQALRDAGASGTGGVVVLYDQNDLKGSKLSAVFTRTGEDVCTFGLYFVKLTSGAPDAAGLTDTNRAAIEARLVTLFASYVGYMATPANEGVTLAFARWHDFGVGIGRPNPVTREHAFTSANVGTDVHELLPPQVALDTTFRTSRRRSWGRIYWPGISRNILTLNGRPGAAAVDDLRTAWGVFTDGVKADNTPLVIWCPRVAGAYPAITGTKPNRHQETPDNSSFALSVDQIAMDDTFDIIRSRRFDKPTHVATHTVA